MKKSNLYDALVLLSSQEGDNPYRDYWKDGILYYTGMGVKGDQDLDFYENKALNEANVNVVTVYLFEGETIRIGVIVGRLFLLMHHFKLTSRINVVLFVKYGNIR